MSYGASEKVTSSSFARANRENKMSAVDFSAVREKSFWRAVFVEFMGTSCFIYLVTAVLIHPSNNVTIAFAIGLAIAILAHVFGPISGGHFNPAITVGTIVTGDVKIIKAICYMIAQIVGGILGAGITYALNPADKRGALGNVALSKDYSEIHGLFIELILTAILVFTFLASSSTDNGRGNFGFNNCLAVGLAITVDHLVGIPYTGSSINPARAFGPAIVGGVWHSYHWIYWIGPIIGGVLAALFYRYIIKCECDQGLEPNETSPLVTYDSTNKRVDVP